MFTPSTLIFTLAHPQSVWTALMYASYYGYLEVVEALVAARADVDAMNDVRVIVII